MRRLVLLSALAAALTTGWSQNPSSVTLPPIPLLPATNQLVAGPDAAPAKPVIDAVLKEDSLKRQESRTFAGAGGKPAGWVDAYEFTDATGAYAAYTYLSMGGRPDPAVNATEVRLASGELVYLAGTSVVRALLPESANGLLKQIANGLPKIGGRRGVAPLLPTLAPAAGLDRDSIRYALGPVGYAAMGGVLPDASQLGWDKSAEVATASYHGHKGILTLLLYPTPQIAGDRGRAIQDMINKSGPASFGTIKMRRLGPLVGVTSGGFSDAQAIDLIGSLKLNQEITFDKKMPVEFHAEVRKTYTLLQSIAIFSGIAILASIVLGVFLGGARAGIRVLQGKPAASEPEFLRIDLRDKPRLPSSDANPERPVDPGKTS